METWLLVQRYQGNNQETGYLKQNTVNGQQQCTSISHDVEIDVFLKRPAQKNALGQGKNKGFQLTLNFLNPIIQKRKPGIFMTFFLMLCFFACFRAIVPSWGFCTCCSICLEHSFPESCMQGPVHGCLARAVIQGPLLGGALRLQEPCTWFNALLLPS